MSTVIDQTDDRNGQELHRIAALYPLPDFVKNANSDDVCGTDDLPPHLFADITRRRFPIHTGPATLISSVFFYEKKAEMPSGRAQPLEQNLLKAAKYFRIGGYLKTIQEKAAALQTPEPVTLEDDTFAIVFKHTDGTKERHYPMRNPREVKTAAAWLEARRDLLPFEDRRQVADKILQKAAQLGADVSAHRDMLEKTAGMGGCASKDAAALIRTRVRILGNTLKPTPIQQELEKLARLCEESPAIAVQHFAPLTKIASIIDQFDREHGLNRRYDDTVERPEDVLFGVTTKIAAEVSDELIGSLTGNYYKRADLQAVPVRDLADTLGEDFADAISTAGAWVDTEKLATIVPTLPRDDAEQFDEVVAAAGIRPFAQKSASVGRAIPAEDHAAIAAAHNPTPGGLWDRLGK